MDAFSKSVLLLFVLLNPFILSVYLGDLVETVGLRVFARHVVRAAGISALVFALFAWGGEAVFEEVLQVRFSSFMVFGGITFLIIGIRLIMGSGPPIDVSRIDSDRVSAAIAMPLMVGPGTIGASVIAGTRLGAAAAAGAIVVAMITTVVAMLAFKGVHDFVRTRNEPLVRRYSHIAGRVTALFTGTFAIEMIFGGVREWLAAIGVLPT